ncbi:hypothetical protein RvY_11623 [Ramazzottius varieornatus]|uniref:Uncharacterized protein n=1 Tax=Ramazzottius varieornatus TaxID=947166 RepID=A0A1D1VQJ3_RAMVA|nr:hypothetical protein RvY_11623 [Ramazzottius varieornatus]
MDLDRLGSDVRRRMRKAQNIHREYGLTFSRALARKPLSSSERYQLNLNTTTRSIMHTLFEAGS